MRSVKTPHYACPQARTCTLTAEQQGHAYGTAELCDFVGKFRLSFALAAAITSIEWLQKTRMEEAQLGKQLHEV